MTQPVVIYCDGSSLGNPGRGGWGAVLCYGEHQKEISGSAKHATNQQMELQAAIEALKALKRSVSVVLYTDSQYVQKGMSEWIYGWKRSSWKNGSLKNLEQWKELNDLASKHQVEWKWVRGHNGDPLNERANVLAQSAAYKQ